jgi:hypothetical protein
MAEFKLIVSSHSKEQQAPSYLVFYRAILSGIMSSAIFVYIPKVKFRFKASHWHN